MTKSIAIHSHSILTKIHGKKIHQAYISPHFIFLLQIAALLSVVFMNGGCACHHHSIHLVTDLFHRSKQSFSVSVVNHHELLEQCLKYKTLDLFKVHFHKLTSGI